MSQEQVSRGADHGVSTAQKTELPVPEPQEKRGVGRQFAVPIPLKTRAAGARSADSATTT